MSYDDVTHARKSSSAFTLIELLVVIAIIAILAAILFPVFAQARAKARQASCLSNQKQVGLGFLQYNQDYDEMMPSAAVGGGQGWAGRIYPYIKNTKVYVCPDDPTTDDIVTSGGTDKRFVAVSYAFNQNLNAPQGNSTPLSLAEFGAPASTVLLFEVVGGHANRTNNTPGLDTIDIKETTSPCGAAYPFTAPNSAKTYATGPMGRRTNTNANFFPAPSRHNNGSVFLACDGHAKWLTGDKVSTYDIAVQAGHPQTTPGKAAGTGNMTDGNGNSFTLTFSQR